MTLILLIHPPVSKPSEPPAGLARLAGFLKARHIEYGVLDLNIEGLLDLLNRDIGAADTWTRRACRNRGRNLAALRDWATYQNRARYGRAVADLERALAKAAEPQGIRVGLANYADENRSPLRKQDLLDAFQKPEQNPFFNCFSRSIDTAVREQKPDWIGFSLNFLSQALCTFAMLGFVKKNFPRLKTILGGGLVTSWMRRPGWNNPFDNLVDEMIGGPGEKALALLLGLETRDQEQEQALPDYGLFPLDKYLSPDLILPYSASSGCYWNRCTFCPEQAEKNPYIPLPAEQVADDLKTLCGKHKPGLIHFTDNALGPRLLQALTQNPPPAPWYGFARCTAHLAEPDFCLALKKSGCLMLKLGVESGDQNVLDQMRKGHTVELAGRILQNLKKAGIAAYVYLLFGTQYETLQEARKTKNFIVQHGNAVDFLNMAIFNLPLHAPVTAGLSTRPFYEGDLSLYTGFNHPQGWGRREVRAFLDREFKKDPSVARILGNDPPLFTSNHAPLFVMGKREMDCRFRQDESTH